MIEAKERRETERINKITKTLKTNGEMSTNDLYEKLCHNKYNYTVSQLYKDLQTMIEKKIIQKRNDYTKGNKSYCRLKKEQYQITYREGGVNIEKINAKIVQTTSKGISIMTDGLTIIDIHNTWIINIL